MGQVDYFPVMGETFKCSKILVCKWRAGWHTWWGTGSARKGVNNKRSQAFGEFIFERKKGRDLCRRAENESSVKMKGGCATKAANLSVFVLSAHL